MRAKKSFTLTELLVLIVIIGILVALALPNYLAIKEKSLNREAKASLALIRAAEKIYRLEQGFYYPYLATATVAADINSFLKLSLPKTVNVNWTIGLNSTAAPEYGTATRSGAGGRVWRIDFPVETDPTCSPAGPNCP